MTQRSVGSWVTRFLWKFDADDITRCRRKVKWFAVLVIKVKIKVHTLDIAPLRCESPPQKRSGMARVLEGFHSFTCTPTRSSAIGMSHTCLCLPSRSDIHTLLLPCCEFLWVIEYQRYWMCNYIDTHRYNVDQITQCRLVQNVQNMCICSSNPDPWFWWALLPLASRATLCLWAPLGHFHLKAPTDFVPPSLIERGPLFFTYCASLTAYVNNVRHYLAPHCGGQA